MSVSTARTHREPVTIQTYERNTANLRRLSAQLPEAVVVNLAREVIRRVALKATVLTHVALAPSPDEIEELCQALISPDHTEAAKFVFNLQTEGAKEEEIYLSYLAASARLLGVWWEEDRVSFAEVTTGSGRVFAIMRSMRHLFEPEVPMHEKKAIFAAVPGEDHTMGVRMAADLFRKDGWGISLKVGLDNDALVAEIEQEPTAIVGLSIGGLHSVEALSRLVVALHISCPQALLLVCGQDIRQAKPVLSLMGLDGIAGDMDEAKEQMAALWEKKAARRQAAQG